MRSGPVNLAKKAFSDPSSHQLFFPPGSEDVVKPIPIAAKVFAFYLLSASSLQVPLST